MLKTCALLSLCAYSGLAADFLTGQAARLVIGQATFTDQLAGASDTLLGAVGGVAFANGTLWVADANRNGLVPINNRVLAFPTLGFPKPLDTIAPFSGRCPVCVGQANLVLGEPDFVSTTYTISASGMRLPTAVATDGVRLAVADTDNNRVLLWNSIPTVNGQPADLELGQPDFNTVLQGSAVIVDNKSFRAPQGVWFQNGKLFVADTQNHRVMIWNSIPTVNRQGANVVLGQPNFNVANQPDLTKLNLDAAQNTLLNPVSVTSDGVRLYVADLGHNRVLIWNSIPTYNQQPADVVIGQKDFVTAISNDSPDLCVSNGLAADGVTPTYPQRCGKTMDFPRFALSDGTRLFIADGGNDRILIYNQIPTQNAPAADVILGQQDEFESQVSSFTDIFHPLLRQSAADITPTPTSLAWDGTNLYVTDAANRRVLVFTPGEALVPINNVRNAASMEIFALGTFTVGGTITAGDVATLVINGTNYVYTVLSTDTLVTVMQALVGVINAGAGDPNVVAQFEPTLQLIKLVARKPGTDSNTITLSVIPSVNATLTLQSSGNTLQGGGNAAILSPGAIVAIFGANLADGVALPDLTASQLPIDLGGVELYCDGIRSPLFYVSPTQINAQLPWELSGSNSTSCYLRVMHSGGQVVASTAVAVPIDKGNPGLFAFPGDDPRLAIAFHGSSYATGTVTVDGSIQAGDVGTIMVEDRTYSYTVLSTDTLDSVRDALVALINANPEERVVAYPVPAFSRLQLRAKVPGPAGEGIEFNASVSSSAAGGALLDVFNLTGQTCCDNIAGAFISSDNPAVPGETIYLYATGLGIVGPDAAHDALLDGAMYTGPALNDPTIFDAGQFVSALDGAATANVLSAALQVGSVALYKIVLELGTNTVPGDFTQLTISQGIYTSNIVTISVLDPNAVVVLPQ